MPHKRSHKRKLHWHDKEAVPGREDLPLTREEGKAKFQSSVGGATVVYDDSSGDMKDLSATHPLVLVMSALMGMGKCYLLRGNRMEGVWWEVCL